MDVLGVAITCICCNVILDPVLRPSLVHHGLKPGFDAVLPFDVLSNQTE